MNAFLFNKNSKEITLILENVYAYSPARIEAETGSAAGINFENVSVLITKHSAMELEESVLPESWLNDEYKIDLLE